MFQEEMHLQMVDFEINYNVGRWIRRVLTIFHPGSSDLGLWQELGTAHEKKS